MDKKKLKEIIKATLFVAGEGIEKGAFADSFDINLKEVEKAVEELKKDFEEDSGIQLVEYKTKIQLSSNPDYADQISSILNPIREKALTKAALETVAIIAYKQPVTKLDIEQIRGVNSDYAVQILIEHKLIEVVGRKDAVGKPLLFGTTDEFLKRFGLKNLDELPNYEALLERIALIRTEETPASDSLYNDFKLPEEEPVPDFLQDEEDVQAISSDVQERLNKLLDDDSSNRDAI